jgi:hypothetical protein
MSGLLKVALAAVLAAEGTATPPHLVMILQDDLGWYDTAIHNPANLDVTGNITALAQAGVVLSCHYVRRLPRSPRPTPPSLASSPILQ